MAMPLEIRVLGGIEVVRDGRPVPIGGPKPRRALALFVARRGAIVSIDRLCEELWGDQPPADAPAVLQSVVSRLRKLLRPEAAIAGRPPGYVLEVDEEAVDVARFEAGCARARTEPDPAARVEQLRAALACWRGGAFEEFADVDWAMHEAVRLDEMRVVAQEELIEARLALGDHASLVGEVEALVGEHPFRERLRHQLVVALYRGGRSADALRHAAAYRKLLHDDLGLDPSPAFRELDGRVLNDDPTLLAAAGPTRDRPSPPRRLPSETTPMIGRGEEIDELVARLRTARLQTLVGPGGVGKTRLALRVARDLWDEYGGAVYVVELASVHDPASTVSAIATAMDVQQRQYLSVEETLFEYLRGRRAMLVLDNCEHLRGTVASLADRLLAMCPEVTLLVTSREVLGIPSEHVWRVEPLGTAPVGADADTIAGAPAVRLFVERAASARPSFALSAANVDALAEIVRRLDGLPLAIELAAARIGAMSPAALAERLDERFDLLGGARTSMTPRHRTLEALVAWSFDLLDPAERELFARLCIFAGTFGLDAAEGVCRGDDLRRSEVSMLLANLVDKSMVQLVDGDLARYRVLETLREFGLGRLAADQRAAVQVQHARWYLDEAERRAFALTGAGEASAMVALERDFDNVRSAHLWSIQEGDVDLAVRLVVALREYGFRCMRAEITNWAEAVMRVPGAEQHARYPVLVAVAGYGRFVRGDLEGAIQLADQAVAAAERLGTDCSGLAERVLGNAWFYLGDAAQGMMWMDRMVASARHGSAARLAHALYMRSVAHTSVGENVKGAQLAGEALAAAASCGSPTARAQAEYALGLALESPNAVEAAGHLQCAADIAREAGNRWVQAFALTEVLWLEARGGKPGDALVRYADVIELWYRGGDWANQWLSLRHVLGILAQMRAHLAAATLYGALNAAGAAYALPFESADADRITELVGDLRAQLGAAAFASAVRRGATLSDGQIIAFVQEQIAALAGSARVAPGGRTADQPGRTSPVW